MNVLVVDDDRTTRFLLRRVLLGEFACTVLEAGDGIEALDVLSRTPCQLVILDVQMPVMDGLETLRVLRQSPTFRTLPVLMLTAQRGESIVREILALGVLDYMTKPLVPERIVERVRRVLGWLTQEAAQTARPLLETAMSTKGAVLIADGDEGFRQFVADTIGSRRKVLQAESGTRAFRICVEANPVAVLVGSGLGVLSDALLVRKIRSTPALHKVYLVAVVGEGEDAAARLAGCDGRLTRTTVREKMLAELEALQASTSGRGTPAGALGGIRAALVSVAEQVSSMMLATDVSLRDGAPRPPEERIMAKAIAHRPDGQVAVLRGCCDVATGRAMAGSLLSIDPSMASEKDADEAVAEVLNTIGSRLQTALAGGQMHVDFEAADVARAVAAVGPPPAEGFQLCLQSQGGHVEFWLSFELLPQQASSPEGQSQQADEAPAPPEGQQAQGETA